MRKVFVITGVLAAISGVCALLSLLFIKHGEKVYCGYTLKDYLDEEHDPAYYPDDFESEEGDFVE